MNKKAANLNAFQKTYTYFLLVFIFGSCSQNEPTQNCSEAFLEDVETFYKSELTSQICTIQGLNNNKSEQTITLKNKSDYEKYITCQNALPEIDFNKYIVLAFRYNNNQCAYLSAQKVQICNNKRLIYTANIGESACLKPSSIYGVIVIDKKYSDLKVEFRKVLHQIIIN